MKKLIESAVAALLGITVGNFGWEAFTDQDWRSAFEQLLSHFFAIVTLTVILILRQKPAEHEQ